MKFYYVFFGVIYLLLACEPEREIPSPIVKGFTPASGKTGTLVTVNGTSLNENCKAYINGVPVSITGIPTSTELKFSLPVNATTGKIRVENSSGFHESATDFIVFSPPVILSFSPSEGTVGTVITISGKNFGPDLDFLIVSFGSVKATILQKSTNMIKVSVPSGASSGFINISGQGGSVVSAEKFLVL